MTAAGDKIGMLCRNLVFMLLIVILLAGCLSTTVRETQPARTATEQLLISTAADHAVEKLKLKLPRGLKVFLETRYIDTVHTPDTKYMIGLIAGHLLQQGYRLMAKREDAEKIVEIRLGALSINEVQKRYLGTPALSLPIPLSGPIGFPEFNFIMKHEQKGVAKIAASVYDAKRGIWDDTAAPVYGFSHLTRWVVFMFGWTSSDLAPGVLEEK